MAKPLNLETGAFIAFLAFLFLSLITIGHCDIQQARETEKTNRLYIERGYCQNGWGRWAPCHPD